MFTTYAKHSVVLWGPRDTVVPFRYGPAVGTQSIRVAFEDLQ